MHLNDDKSEQFEQNIEPHVEKLMDLCKEYGVPCLFLFELCRLEDSIKLKALGCVEESSGPLKDISHSIDHINDSPAERALEQTSDLPLVSSLERMLDELTALRKDKYPFPVHFFRDHLN